MKHGTYLLSQLWPNKNFFDLDETHLEIFRQAFRTPVKPSPTSAPPPVSQLYTNHLHDWQIHGAPVKFPRASLLQLLELKAVRRGPAADKIKVNFPDLTFAGWEDGETVWKWTHYDQAFAIDWALLFHLTNRQLADPLRVWGQLVSVYHQLRGAQADDFVDYTAWKLALYERVMGLYVDMHEKRAHWVKNIQARTNLTREEGDQRVELFKRTVDHLRIMLELRLEMR